MKPMPRRACFRFFLILAVAVLLSPHSNALAGDLRAGVARLDITPTLPVKLAGYGSRTNLSQGVHDRLSARALVFEQDGQRLALVSTDVLGFYNDTADPMRKTIAESCGLKTSEVFLCAIHTHSAPTVVLDPEKGHSNNVAYSKSLLSKLVAVVGTAMQNMAPVQIGFGSGASPVGSNRRQVVQDNAGQTKIVLGRNPSLLTDREVQVLKVGTQQNQVTAVLFAYATHSTSLGPRNYIVSGDIHGLAEQFLENYWGPKTVAPGFAGASGDIDPWYRVLPEFKTTNGWVPEPVLLGTLLGEEVAHVAATITNTTGAGPIKTLFKTIDLPAKPRGEGQASTNSTAPFNITVGRLGGIAFVGMGGEVFNEIGQAIKSASPFRHTVIMTHCNGAAGYIPTQASYPDGGYEVTTSSFAPGADRLLIEEATRLLKQLQ